MKRVIEFDDELETLILTIAAGTGIALVTSGLMPEEFDALRQLVRAHPEQVIRLSKKMLDVSEENRQFFAAKATEAQERETWEGR